MTTRNMTNNSYSDQNIVLNTIHLHIEEIQQHNYTQQHNYNLRCINKIYYGEEDGNYDDQNDEDCNPADADVEILFDSYEDEHEDENKNNILKTGIDEDIINVCNIRFEKGKLVYRRFKMKSNYYNCKYDEGYLPEDN